MLQWYLIINPWEVGCIQAFGALHCFPALFDISGFSYIPIDLLKERDFLLNIFLKVKFSMQFYW